MSVEQDQPIVSLFSTEWEPGAEGEEGATEERLLLIDRSDIVVTLPRYSPSSTVTTIDPEPSDPPSSTPGLDSPSNNQFEEEVCSSMSSVATDRLAILESPEHETSVVVYEPKVNPIIEEKMSQLLNVAQFHEESQDYTSAIISYTKAINLRPRDRECLIRRAECYLKLGDLQSAVLGYKRLSLLCSDDEAFRKRLSFLFYLRGQFLFDQKLYEYALEAFEKATNIDQSNPWFQYRSMSCLAALGRLGECLAMVSEHLTGRLPPSKDITSKNITTDIYVLRARIHAKLGNTSLCYYDIRDVLLLDPDHSEAKHILRILEERSIDLMDQSIRLMLTGRGREAGQRLTTAIDTDPSNAKLLVYRGIVLRHAKNYNAALDDFLLAIEKAKSDSARGSDVLVKAQRQLLLTYNDFAVDCCGKNFFDEAIVLLNRAIKEEKREKGLYLNRGDCFYRTGNMSFALADYMQALEIDPGDLTICRRIAEVHAHRANVLFEDRKFPEAEVKSSHAIKYNPLSSSFYTLRCKARELLGTLDGAQRDAITALTIDPNNAEIVNLMTRLFPGKSVGDIMSSALAEEIQKDLGKIVGSRKTPEMEKKNEKSQNPFTSENVVSLVGLQEDELLSKFTRCSRRSKIFSRTEFLADKDFHLGVVEKKKEMNTSVRRVLCSPLILSKDKHLLSKKASKHETISARGKTTTAPHQPTTGWQKFRKLDPIS